jgi:hypothetical protein
MLGSRTSHVNYALILNDMAAVVTGCEFNLMCDSIN